jgi:Predicted dehydrogenases and related proteins
MGFLLAGGTAIHSYNIETEIMGTKGTLRIGSVPQKNLVEILDEYGVRKECHDTFLDRFEQAYADEMQEFVNFLQQGRKPSPSFDDGLKATIIAYKCRESFESGKLVKTGL